MTPSEQQFLHKTLGSITKGVTLYNITCWAIDTDHPMAAHLIATLQDIVIDKMKVQIEELTQAVNAPADQPEVKQGAEPWRAIDFMKSDQEKGQQ